MKPAVVNGESETRVSRLRWWSDAQLARVGRRVDAACAAWREGWVAKRAGDACVAVNAHAFDLAANRDWKQLGTREGGMAWVSFDEKLLAPLLFEDIRARSDASPIANAVAQRAYADLLNTLRSQLNLLTLEGSADAPSLSAFRNWSGYVAISISIGDTKLAVLLDTNCAELLIGAKKPSDAQRPASTALAPLHQALAHRTLRIRIELQGCELDLGTLEDLRVGDVILLAHELANPLHLSVHGERFGEGFLGRRAGRKAIELQSSIELLQPTITNPLQDASP